MHWSENPKAGHFKNSDSRECTSVYCIEQLFRSLHIFGLEALEATLGDGDIGDEGVQLVHLRKGTIQKLLTIED